MFNHITVSATTVTSHLPGIAGMENTHSMLGNGGANRAAPTKTNSTESRAERERHDPPSLMPFLIIPPGLPTVPTLLGHYFLASLNHPKRLWSFPVPLHLINLFHHAYQLYNTSHQRYSIAINGSWAKLQLTKLYKGEHKEAEVVLTSSQVARSNMTVTEGSGFEPGRE
ncbi:hypothetical protein O3P69_015926 [Scylla paramamosain]|uniref:Uncharacterized protein n=1 Tax=Scylla paramamosain TaxID=85552 RepID=A0AAW0T895_SCYPA